MARLLTASHASVHLLPVLLRPAPLSDPATIPRLARAYAHGSPTLSDRPGYTRDYTGNRTNHDAMTATIRSHRIASNGGSASTSRL